MQKPSEVTNAARYDKTQKSGNLKSFIANIMEHMTSYKGATKGGPARKPTYATKQAQMVARAK